MSLDVVRSDSVANEHISGPADPTAVETLSAFNISTEGNRLLVIYCSVEYQVSFGGDITDITIGGVSINLSNRINILQESGALFIACEAFYVTESELVAIGLGNRDIVSTLTPDGNAQNVAHMGLAAILFQDVNQTILIADSNGDSQTSDQTPPVTLTLTPDSGGGNSIIFGGVVDRNGDFNFDWSSSDGIVTEREEVSDSGSNATTGLATSKTSGTANLDMVWDGLLTNHRYAWIVGIIHEDISKPPVEPFIQLPSRFSMPELLIPGRQPQSIVSIDKNHPLVNKLQFAVVASQPKELVRNLNLVLRNSAIRIITEKQSSFQVYSSTSIIEIEGSEAFSISDGQPISIAVLIYINSSDPSGTIINKRNSGGLNWRLHNNVSPPGISMGLGTRDDELGGQPDVVGRWVSWGTSWDGNTTMRHYNDGAFERLDTNFASTDPQSNSDPVALGASWLTYPSVSTGIDALIPYAFVWYGRELTPADFMSLHNNPYQFLVPEH